MPGQLPLFNNVNIIINGVFNTTRLRKLVFEMQVAINNWFYNVIHGVMGPTSSTDNAIARWDGTGGNLLQNSRITISDTDVVELNNGSNSLDIRNAGNVVGADVNITSVGADVNLIGANGALSVKIAAGVGIRLLTPTGSVKVDPNSALLPEVNGAQELGLSTNLWSKLWVGGVHVLEGSNATMGTATLSGGTVTVSTTKVTANSRIFLTTNGGTLTNVGFIYVSARTAATSFAITSSNVLDASNVAWLILEPA